MLLLGALEHPVAALTLLRELRAGTLDPRAWPELPTITFAPLVGDGELDALRAYEVGSDHHLPASASYLHLRAVLHAVSRRTRGATRRVQRVGAIELDTVAREVRVAGQTVELSAKEFALLSTLAGDPRRVFTKDELLRDVWGFRAPGRTRTLDSHACQEPASSPSTARAVVNVWGVSYCFSTSSRRGPNPTSARPQAPRGGPRLVQRTGPKRIVGVSKTAYVLTTARCLDCRYDQ